MWTDGRWGCTVNDAHRHAIGVQLGVITEIPEADLPAADTAALRALDLEAEVDL